MNTKEMKRRVSDVKKITGKSKFFIYSDMLFCGLFFGAGYIDYTIFGMYDMNFSQRKNILTRAKNNKYVAALNDKSKWYIFDNKFEFIKTFSDYIGRDTLAINENSFDEFKIFTDKHKTFFAKPINGTCGRGIEKISVDNNKKEIFDYLIKNDLLLIEQPIIQHEALNKLYPNAINTVRIVTIRNDKDSFIIYAGLRIGSGGKDVDNFNTGGLTVPIDIKSGKIIYPAVNKNSQTFDVHPDTKTSIVGFEIPYWDDIIDIAKKASKVVEKIRYVGWDVALTPDGPILVEGNQFPGHDIYQLVMHNPNKEGMLPVFEKVYPYKSLKKMR